MRPAALALLLAVAAAAPVEAQADPADARRPPLYLVQAGGAKVYLLGSIHVLPEGALPLPPHVEAAYAAASAVAFEVDLGAADDVGVDLLLAATDEATIAELLDDAQLEALRTSLRAFGMPGGTFDEVEPWYGGMSYGMLTLRDRTVSEGVDAYLYERAWLDGKRVIALETVADQIEAFDRLSEPSQVAYLMALVEGADGAPAAFDAMLEAWASGDDARLEGVLNDELRHPEVYDSILVRRNRAWLPQVRALLEAPGGVSLVVVGAGHLVGRANLVELLREAGLKVRRL